MEDSAKKKIVYAIYIASFLSYFVFFTNFMLADFYKTYNYLSQSVVILLTTLPGLVQCGASIILGLATSKVNKKVLIVSGLVLGLVGTVGIAILNGSNFYVHLVLTCLVGLCYTFIFNGGSGVIIDLYGKDAHQYVARNNAIGCAGNIIITFIAGKLTAQYSWSTAYYLGALLVLPIVAVLILYKPLPKDPVAVSAGNANAKPKTVYTKTNIISFVVVLFCTCLFAIGCACYNQNFAKYVIMEAAIGDASNTSVMASLASAGSFVGGMFLVQPMRKVFKRYTSPVMGVLMVAAMSLIPLGVKNIYALYAGAFLIWTFWAGVGSQQMMEAGLALPGGRGTMFLPAGQSLFTFVTPYILTIAASLGDTSRVKITFGIGCMLAGIIINVIFYMLTSKKAE